MKKVLLYVQKKDLRPVGGPLGYLYNLYSGKQDKGEYELCFLPDTYTYKSKFNWIKKFIPKIILDKRNTYLREKTINNIINGKVNPPVDLNEYDIVHFHLMKDMYPLKDSLKNYRGKILYTSHSPKPSHCELVEDYLLKDELNDKKPYYLEKLKECEEYCIRKADYVVFPCEEAMEPYLKRWDFIKDYYNQNKDKFLFFYSGVKQCLSKIAKNDYRQEHNISAKDFVISYVGRHNETKGYDNLKILGESLLSRNKDITFIVGGKETPLTGLKNKKWLEIGWTNDPHSLINCADIFVLPNKETYFDLIMLEVLSLGKIVVASNTGGNKVFKDFDCGVFLYDTLEEAQKIILMLKNMDLKSRKILEEKNKKIYQDIFTCEKFYQRYINVLKKVN